MRYINNYKEYIKNIVKDKNFKYYINTMGCSMNENDSMKYSGILEEMGYIKTENEANADFILFNTCSIRENADNTLFGRLGKIKILKQKNKNLILCIAGCMGTQERVVEKIKKSYPYVDIILGTNSMHLLSEKIYNKIKLKKKHLEYILEDTEILEDVPIKYTSDTKASVSIVYGCNQFCTYCIVPFVRNRVRSRLKENIINDVKKLAENGYKEITLLGQNVNIYGKDIGETFAGLLIDLCEINGIENIKFISPHPHYFSDDVIDVIAKNKKIDRHIHLPLQSGSTKVLNDMRRVYTKESYLDLVEKMKKKIDGVTFSTDIIVGFPTETEDDFKETLDVVKKVGFDQIFMFIFSKRTLTKAYDMIDVSTEKQKSDRFMILKKLYEEILFEKNEKLVGKEFDVIVEGKSKTDDSKYVAKILGKTIIISGQDIKLDEKVKIKITKNRLYHLDAIKV